jgi:hypothetical protein
MKRKAMNTRKIFSPQPAAAIALSLTVIFTGCKSASPIPDDASLNSAIQTRLAADPNLNGQTVQASVSNGVATLTGAVTSETARNIAGGDVGQIAGVKTVVNNLLVQPPLPASAPAPAVAANVTPLPAPPARESKEERAERLRKERAMRQQNQAPPAAPIERPAPNQQQPQPAAAPEVAQAPLPPPPPPAPAIHDITLPAGTDLPVRITETLDSATTQTGDKFTGAIASDIIVDGMVVLPQGTPVTGHVDDVQDAAHFKGSSLLTVSLNAINRHGERIQVSTEAYTKQGEGRGKNTAEKVGGGAAVGAILGGIFGGGKGAAIGSVAGGGLGAGAQSVTRGQQVQIPSETVVRFKLADPIVVHIRTGGDRESYGPALERHDQ